MNNFAKTDIANLALSHLLTGKAIQSLDTEQSPEANTMRVYYPLALGVTLREFAWPFTTQYAQLALVTTYPPNQGYAYQYAYRRPSDCVVIRRINSGMRRDTAYTRVPFTESSDVNGPLILTDLPPSTGYIGQAMIEYTQFNDNPSLYPDDFVFALSLRLAVMAAPRITGGDPFKVGQNCERQYYLAISKAQAAALNEVEMGPALDSEFMMARDEGSDCW